MITDKNGNSTGSPHIRLKYEEKNARVLCFEAAMFIFQYARAERAVC